MKIVYHSKISYTFLGIIFILFAAISVVSAQSEKATVLNNLIIFIIQALSFSYLLYLFFNLRYVIEDKILTVKYGFCYKKSIPILDIVKIYKTNSLISSPAASLTDRIALQDKNYITTIISPKNKIKFIQQLKKINPKIKTSL